MSRIINIYDMAINLDNLLCIRINHGIESHRIIFQYKLRMEYSYNPLIQSAVPKHITDMTSKTFKSFNEAREAYESFVLEWSRYVEEKERYFPLLDSLDLE